MLLLHNRFIKKITIDGLLKEIGINFIVLQIGAFEKKKKMFS